MIAETVAASTEDDGLKRAPPSVECELPPTSQSPILLLGLVGFLAASVTSTVLCLYRLEHPHAFPSLPQVTFVHAVALSGTAIALMMIQIYHSLSLLQLLALQMPIKTSSIPFLGHGIRFMQSSPWDLLLAWHKQCGRVFCFPLMGRTVVSIADPDYLRLLLQSKIRNVKKDVGFSYQPFLVILGKGIVTSEGDSWMKQRLKMSTTLRHDVLDCIPQVTLDAVQRLMIRLDDAAENNTLFELSEALRHLTLQVISNTFLSLSAQESDSNFATMYLPIVDECNMRVWQPWRSACIFMPFWWKHQFHIYRLNKYVSKLIQTRWEERHHGGIRKNDIMDIVLDAYEKEHSTLTWTAIQQMRDEMKTFMLAGHETSAAMMTWALYELMGNKDMMNEVATEGEKVFGKDVDWRTQHASDLPPRNELANLVVAEGALKESLRKYSVVPLVVRHCINPIEMGPYTLTKGTTLLINIQAVHHDPELWPDPMTFDPHRFIDSRPEAYTFLPFIDGPRNCLGQHLALLESKIVLGLLMQRYRFEVADNDAVQTELHGGLDRDPRHRFIVPVCVKKDLQIKVIRK